MMSATERVAGHQGTRNPEEECPHAWLEDYLERLDGKDAYREFQDRCYGTPEYYALAA